MKAAALLLAPALAACAAPASAPGLEVGEAGRSAYCNTPGEAARAALLPDAAAVLAWQAGRGIALLDAAAAGPGPYALVEMGLRSTGGYDVTVSPGATLRDGELVLQAAFSAPAPGSLRTQALSSPCVLLRLPPGRYATVEVRDRSGARLAHGGVLALPEPAAGGPVR
jgi:hypothetical protein